MGKLAISLTTRPGTTAAFNEMPRPLGNVETPLRKRKDDALQHSREEEDGEEDGEKHDEARHQDAARRRVGSKGRVAPVHLGPCIGEKGNVDDGHDGRIGHDGHRAQLEDRTAVVVVSHCYSSFCCGCCGIDRGRSGRRSSRMRSCVTKEKAQSARCRRGRPRSWATMCMTLEAMRDTATKAKAKRSLNVLDRRNDVTWRTIMKETVKGKTKYYLIQKRTVSQENIRAARYFPPALFFHCQTVVLISPSLSLCLSLSRSGPYRAASPPTGPPAGANRIILPSEYESLISQPQRFSQ